MMDPIGPIRVLVLETEPQFIANARAALEGDTRMVLVGSVTDHASLLDKVGSTYANVAVVDIAGLRGDVGPAVHEILAQAPECCVIVTGSNVAPGVVSRAVTAGARGFLLKPYQPEDFVGTIRDAYLNFQELRRLQRIERTPGTTSRPGAVIAVYSPKGGVGCTTIATNLAVCLARRSGKSTVALVDLDLQFGDIGIALDLKSANSVADLLAHVDSIDQQLVDEVFVRHTSGVRALLAPDNLASVPTIDPDRVARVVDQLRPHFQYIVCDLWSSLEELTLATLRMADRIILVTTPELPALRNLRRVMSATGLLLQDDRTILVANRVPGKAGVSLSEIERGLGRSIAATIPSEGVGITEAINRGMSMLDDRARAKAGASYKRLADLIAVGLEPAAVGRAHRSVPAAANQ
ncbi:MAG: AAA family ATPase [Chloroflexota bacterium]